MASDEKVETLTEAIRELNKTGREQVQFFKLVHETMRELIEILNDQPLQPEGEIIRDPAPHSYTEFSPRTQQSGGFVGR